IVSPGKTVLQRGEFLVAFALPRPKPHSADAYLRLTPRSEMDIALVGAAVSLTLDTSGVCTAPRVALAAVVPRPRVGPRAAAAPLVGRQLDGDGMSRAAEAASAAARPIDDKRGTIAYRRQITGVLTRRAAAIAGRRVKGGY